MLVDRVLVLLEGSSSDRRFRRREPIRQVPRNGWAIAVNGHAGQFLGLRDRQLILDIGRVEAIEPLTLTLPIFPSERKPRAPSSVCALIDIALAGAASFDFSHWISPSPLCASAFDDLHQRSFSSSSFVACPSSRRIVRRWAAGTLPIASRGHWRSSQPVRQAKPHGGYRDKRTGP